jgi:hypothetical protein
MPGMKLQVGDKVRFLNEAIEGTVSGLLSNNRVEVGTADGFTLTAFSHELVRVDFDIGMAGEVPLPAPEKRIVPAPPEPKPVPKNDVSIVATLDPDDTIYAAVVLADALSPLTTDIELFLVNNTSYSLSFVCSRKHEDLLELCQAGILNSRSEKSIGLYSQDELHAMDGFHFSILFFNTGQYKPLPPFEKTLHVESNQFLDSRQWEKAGESGNRVLLTPLKSPKVVQDISLEKLMEKFTPPPEAERKEVTRNRPTRPKPTPKYVILAKEKVVDLHIEELLKDFSGLSNAQIISHQINCFQKEMDQAILNKLHKITFIHGVGQGVLKSAIREELKKYDQVRYEDGPPEKYGYGATEVIFD